jgi:phosphopantothenoylcysteine decarboxylase/phosphopantothenate--cysteine ligase
MQDFTNKKILLGVCGGIAAYKSVFLVRELTRLGAEVRVVMTTSAKAFITPMTFQALSGNSVRDSLFDAEAERAMGHIELARWADCLIIAPASANCLAKMAQGIADDLLSTLYLVAEIPVFIAPAMNRSMWAHPATQANIALLQSRAVIMIGPGEGSQACGEYGLGRMAEVDEILTALRLLGIETALKGKKVLITAGPTRESIDPVRYISNCSSGKMGYALAHAAAAAGAQVILISGSTALTISSGITVIPVESASEMHDAVMTHLEPGMIFIGSAAVADYRLTNPYTSKIKKHQTNTLTLDLVKNPDILSLVAASGHASLVVGFAAETESVIENAREKLINKKLDIIIANQVGKGLGFDNDNNQVTVITKREQFDLPLMHKMRLAGQIIAIIASTLQNNAH